MENPKGLKLLREYKNKIMEAIIDDQELVQAIANNNPMFLENPIEDPSTLLYKNIFPYKWTAPEIPEEKTAYLTMDFAVDRMQGGVFNNITFTIYVLVHKDIMRIDDGTDYMLRSDFIMEKLESIFHMSKDFGVGRLLLVDTMGLFVNPEIVGFGLVFSTIDQAARG